jgi:processive 1,2-diacylglycerol beta-glucosyltransferase
MPGPPGQKEREWIVMAARVLVLSASVGVRHVRAAQSIELALRELAPEAEVKNRDVLKLTSAAFGRTYTKTYLDLVTHSPYVLGFFYDAPERPRRARSTQDRLLRLVERLNLSRICDELACSTWDVVVNTHFLPAEIIALLRRQEKIRTPQITVTTDFELHRLWVNAPTDHYCTATEESKAYIHHWGVPLEQITVTGMPIHPVFAQHKAREVCLERQGLLGDRPVVLQLSGSLSSEEMAQLYEAVLAVQMPLELVVVAGKNKKGLERLQGISPPPRHRVKLVGFTSHMDELIGAADVVLSKPGGLTTAEALARGAAMVIVNPLPGQETRNSDFLLENGAAIKIGSLATMARKLEKLLRDPALLEQLKANARKLGRPRAAYDVARLALNWAGRDKPAR